MAFQLQRMLEFQFTRPRGARLMRLLMRLIVMCFNSRAHEGRDFMSSCSVLFSACFNSRAHEGRDMMRRNEVSVPCGFNSRAHEGRDLLRDGGSHWAMLFQFTRPRGARQDEDVVYCTYHVSIHAPTRGATASRELPFREVLVSIHAPTRGATHQVAATGAQRCFNSRAHEGRDDRL